MKKKVIEVESLAKVKSSKKALKELEELQVQHRHLVNKRRETLLAVM